MFITANNAVTSGGARGNLAPRVAPRRLVSCVPRIRGVYRVATIRPFGLSDSGMIPRG